MNKTNQLQIKLQNFDLKQRNVKIGTKNKGTKVGINAFNECNEGILKNINIHLLLIYLEKR